MQRYRETAGKIALLIFLGLIMGVGHAQFPLYSSNQNTYFVHGLADGGLGFLSHDWLAHTRDPFPVFSLLINLTYRFASEKLFYGYQFLLAGVYLFSLSGIAAILYPPGRSKTRQLAFLAIAVFLYSALIRHLVQNFFGPTTGWVFPQGFAGFEILGPLFQPSSFGVFFLFAIYLCLNGRRYGSVAFAVLPAIMHSCFTYILVAALLAISFMYDAWRERDPLRRVLLMGGLALALILPTLVYMATMLRPTDPQTYARATQIIVDYRIPHHTHVDRWLDKLTYAKAASMILALFLVRKTRLFAVLGPLFLVMLALSGLQMATQNKTLALMLPWRISVVLFPLTGTILAAAVVSITADFAQRRPGSGIAAPLQIATFLLSLSLLAWVMVRGAQETGALQRVQAKAKDQAMVAFVRKTKRNEDVYLIPPGMEQFRLQTGVPVVADFKSHPIKDREVIEWYERETDAEEFYRGNGKSSSLLNKIRKTCNITHIVMPAGLELKGPGIRKVYGDMSFTVFHLQN